MNAELKAQILEALESALRAGRKQGWWDSNERVMDELKATIALLEALAPTTERELAIIRATQSAINSAMFEEYGTSTGVRIDPATVLKELK